MHKNQTIYKVIKPSDPRAGVVLHQVTPDDASEVRSPHARSLGATELVPASKTGPTPSKEMTGKKKKGSQGASPVASCVVLLLPRWNLTNLI